MNKVLLICDSFPPYGGLRAGSLAKYLPHFEWSPEVMAWSLKNIYADEGNFQGISELNDRQVNWVSTSENPDGDHSYPIIDRLNLLLRPELSRPNGLFESFLSVGENQVNWKGIQAIISTTSGWLPVFSAASYFSRKYQIPWIADLRDIDEQWPANDKASWRLKVYRSRGIIRRQQLLKHASAIVTISRWHRRFLENKCKRPVHLVFNGYDPEFFDDEPPPVNRNHFLITYTGALLGNSAREPEAFFEACNQIVKNNKQLAEHLKIRFFSPQKNAETIHQLAQRFHLEDKIAFCEQIKHTKVPFVLAESAILLLVTSRHTRGQMTTKFYEYLASRRPILCVPEDDGSIKDILAETKAGLCTNSVDDIARFIEKHYQFWTDSRNPFSGHRADLSLFSRKYQASEFAQILRRVAKK